MVYTGSTSTTDGIIRRPEVDPALLVGSDWNGRGHYSYIPPAAPELRLPPAVRLHSEFDLDIDPVSYQVLRNRFWSINLDHSDTIRRVSGSPVIVYMDDFNTALLTETADLFMAGPSIQWFAALGDLPIKWTMENRGVNPGINDGDVFFHNDPWVGCTHAMDVGMFAPVFHEGRIFSWIFSQCHVGDVGGPFPGSFNPLADDLYQEPALVSPIKLVQGGELQLDVLEMHTRKSRTRDHLALQMRSQIAGINTVQARMAEVLAEYGAATVKGAMRRLIRDSSAAIGERLSRIPDGEWNERLYMAGLGGDDRKVHRFSCCIRKHGDQLVVTDRGTDEQYKAASSTYGSWRSGALVAVTSFLGWDQLLCNAGALDHVSFEPTPGTLSVATYPAATTGVGGNTAAVYLSAFTLSKMLMSGPDDLKRRANGAGGQAIPSFWFGAGNDRNGRFVVQPPGDVVAGALGAFPDRDGVDIGGAWWWPNNPAGNAEEWEAALPILYLYRRERTGSGGAGRWRGGNSLETAMILHKTDEMLVQLVSLDNAINCALGIGGGLPGHTGDYRKRIGGLSKEQLADGVLPGTPDELEEAVGDLTRMFSKEIGVMRPGDVFVAQYCGGGGCFDPTTREAELVAADVRRAAISSQDAREVYGVVLIDRNRVALGAVDVGVDITATEELRGQIRSGRLAMAEPPRTPDAAQVDIVRVQGAVRPAVVVGLGPAGEERWACDECGHGLGPAAENYKDGAARLERPPQEINPRQYLDPTVFCDDPFVMRQFLCPACGVTLSIELCKPDDPPVVDARLTETELALA